MAIAVTDHDSNDAGDTSGITRSPRYVDARRVAYGALEVGVDLVALLVLDSLATRLEAARAARRRHRNPPWGTLARNLGPVRGWIDDGESIERMHELLVRQGVHLETRVLRQYVACYTAARTTTTTNTTTEAPAGSDRARVAAAAPDPTDRPVAIDLTSEPAPPVPSLTLVPDLDRARTA